MVERNAKGHVPVSQPYTVTDILHATSFILLLLQSPATARAQIHRCCLKVYPKMCHKIILDKSYDVVRLSYDIF